MINLFTYLAAVQPTGLGGELKGKGPLGLEGKNPTDVFTLFPSVISTIIGVLTASAILWFIFQFIIGAFGWVSSGGDQKAVEAARSRITNAVIGIILVFGALVLISVLGSLMGLDVLNLRGMLCSLGAGQAKCL